MQFSRLIAKVLNLMCAVCIYPWRLLSEYVGPYGPVVQVTLGVVTQGIWTGPLEAGQMFVIGVEKAFDQGQSLSLISCGLPFL